MASIFVTDSSIKTKGVFMKTVREILTEYSSLNSGCRHVFIDFIMQNIVVSNDPFCKENAESIKRHAHNYSTCFSDEAIDQVMNQGMRDGGMDLAGTLFHIAECMHNC